MLRQISGFRLLKQLKRQRPDGVLAGDHSSKFWSTEQRVTAQALLLFSGESDMGLNVRKDIDSYALIALFFTIAVATMACLNRGGARAQQHGPANSIFNHRPQRSLRCRQP
jgi:hypothetical protein